MGSTDAHLSAPVIDRAVLEDLSAIDPAIVVDLVHAFVSDVPHRIVALERSAAERSGNDILREAHGLKGGACAIGAVRLAELCAAIETDACAGHFDDAIARTRGLMPAFVELTQTLERISATVDSRSHRGAA